MRRERVGMLVALIGTMAFWFAHAWQHLAYLNDDLIVFHVASQGLTRHLLVYNLFEHFSPIDHFFYWFELHIVPLDPRVGTVIAAAILLLMLCCLSWLLRELEIGWPLRAAAVALVGTSFVTLVVTTWWGQAVYIPVAMTATLLIMAAHVRGCRLNSWRWHAAACGFSVVGLLISERTLFTPAYLVLLDLAVAMRMRSYRGALREVWSTRWALAPLFGLSLAGAVFIRLFYYMSFPLPHLSDVLQLIGVEYANWFLPSLGGFYSHAGASRGVALGLVVASVAACAWLIVVDRRNLGAIVFFAAAFIMEYGFLGIGRLGLYSISEEASDIQYIAWILPLLAVAVALITLPAGWRAGWTRVRRPAAVLGVLATLALLANISYVAQTSDAFRVRADGYQYWINLRNGMASWSSTAVTVLPLAMPIELAAPFVDPYGRLEVLLPEISPAIHVGLHDAGSTPVVIDASGAIRVAALRTDESLTGAQVATESSVVGGTLRTDGAAACLSPHATNAYLQLRLPHEVTGDPLIIQLTYVTTLPTNLRFTALAGSAVTYNPLLSPLYPGSHTAVFLLEATAVSQLQLSGFEPGVDVCLASLSVVTPVVVDANHVCRTIGRHAEIGDVTACPFPT